ncbi:MAG TPA: hypothetical protein VF540_05355 [Segetibacter sp.]
MVKISTFITAAFIFSTIISSCKNSEDAKTIAPQLITLPNDEKETAEREISARVDEIVKGANSLNVDAALQPYLDDSDFKIVNPDASVTDYQSMKNTQIEAFKSLSALNFKTIKQDFTFLEKDLVMFT